MDCWWHLWKDFLYNFIFLPSWCWWNSRRSCRFAHVYVPQNQKCFSVVALRHEAQRSISSQSSLLNHKQSCLFVFHKNDMKCVDGVMLFSGGSSTGGRERDLWKDTYLWLSDFLAPQANSVSVLKRVSSLQ